MKLLLALSHDQHDQFDENDKPIPRSLDSFQILMPGQFKKQPLSDQIGNLLYPIHLSKDRAQISEYSIVIYCFALSDNAYAKLMQTHDPIYSINDINERCRILNEFNNREGAGSYLKTVKLDTNTCVFVGCIVDLRAWPAFQAQKITCKAFLNSDVSEAISVVPLKNEDEFSSDSDSDSDDMEMAWVKYQARQRNLERHALYTVMQPENPEQLSIKQQFYSAYVNLVNIEPVSGVKLLSEVPAMVEEPLQSPLLFDQGQAYSKIVSCPDDSRLLTLTPYALQLVSFFVAPNLVNKPEKEVVAKKFSMRE